MEIVINFFARARDAQYEPGCGWTGAVLRDIRHSVVTVAW